MCGRYALSLRASEVRAQFQNAGMPVEEAPDDDEVRQSYNVAPRYHELVYRADVPYYGAGGSRHSNDNAEGQPEPEEQATELVEEAKETRYKLQSMKWGLVPFWTKRNPDYGSMMKTINCRDDSLAENRGMWNTMKQKKRCIVICQGFYEWLKKNGGKEKIPHFVKRKDGQLMCFAGLWDCAQFEGSEEKLWTYTIITTDSNPQLRFLHDRMPVILDNGSDDIRTWLDPQRSSWSRELQSLLKPYKGNLEYYPVSKDVGKVGNNSPTFIVPIDSTENKNNIANFFGNAKTAAKGKQEKNEITKEEEEAQNRGTKVEHEDGEDRKTINQSTTEDNAPLPVPQNHDSKAGIKHERDDDDGSDIASKSQKISETSPTKSIPSTERKTRSATSNGTIAKSSPSKTDGSQKITNFFNK
ncbi:MAG: hypothetical protein M1812_006959 [Candelaria pacifica]|nr:MAG: hypothetical protein M1812_006959 [Candelaria pacifica]